MILPAKRTRQTGFLFPNLYFSSRDGFNFETPFFINLSPSADLTLFPRYFTDRGLDGGAEFRYALEENSKGMFLAHYLDDDLSDPEAEPDYYSDGKFTHSNQERYWVRGKADQNVGEWITRLDVDVVSDLDYLREFNTGSTAISANQNRYLDGFGRGFQEKTDKYRNNTLGFLRAWENGTTLQGEFLAVNDVSEKDYTADDPSVAWQLPSLTYSGLLPISDEGGADFAWDANYVNFWRNDGVDAQRVDLFPVVSTAVPLSPYLETTVKGGVRDTAYVINDNGASEWEDTSSENRFLYNLGGEVGTTFMRDFGFKGDEINSWSHMLRPYVAYEYTDIPDDVKLPQFDTIDALEDENIIFYGLNNFFKVYGERGGREFDRDYAFVKFKQGYDLRNEMSDEPFIPLEMESGFYPVRNFRLKYTNQTDMYGDGLFYHAVETDYFSSRGDQLGLDYRYDSVKDINSISGSIWYLLPYNFAAGYSLERAIETEVTIDTFTLKQSGISGSAVIGENTTLIVDIYELIQTVQPEWFAVRGSIEIADDAGEVGVPHLLLVEDSDFFRNQVRKFIEDDGYTVDVAEDGLVAWNMLDAACTSPGPGRNWSPGSNATSACSERCRTRSAAG